LEQGNGSDPEEAWSFEDSRGGWIFICFLLGVPTFVGYLLNRFHEPEPLDFPFEPWSAWFVYGFMILLYGFFATESAMVLLYERESIRSLDKVGMAFAFGGFSIIVWNTVFRHIIPIPGIDVPRPTMSIVLLVAGLVLWYGKAHTSKS